MSCLWGKLASEILMQRWDDAYDDLNLLKVAIENKYKEKIDIKFDDYLARKAKAKILNRINLSF